MDLIPYSSFIVLTNNQNGAVKTNDSVSKAFVSELLSAIRSSNNDQVAYRDALRNMQYENGTFFFVNVPETMKMLETAFVQITRKNNKDEEYINKLLADGKINIEPFCIFLKRLFNTIRYKSKDKGKSVIRTDFDRVATYMATIGVVTSADTLRVIQVLTQGIKDAEEMVDAVNGLMGVQTIFKNADVLDAKTRKLQEIVDFCKANHDSSAEGLEACLIQRLKTEHLLNDDIDRDIYIATKKKELTTKYAFIERYAQQIAASRNALVNLVLVRPNDTKAIRGLKRFLGIFIGIFILTVPPMIIVSSAWYLKDRKELFNVIAAIVMLFLISLFKKGFNLA